MLSAVSMVDVLQSFVEILVGAISSLAEGIATGVVTMAKALFLEYNEGTLVGLSVFGGIIAIFAKLLGKVKSRKNGEGFNTNTVLCFSIS